MVTMQTSKKEVCKVCPKFGIQFHMVPLVSNIGSFLIRSHYIASVQNFQYATADMQEKPLWIIFET
jgi:hypothetical protein